VQTTVRRFTRIVAVGAVALIALGGLASSAFAVEEGVDLGEGGTQLCTFNVLPNPLPADGNVHIEGTAPPFATVVASRADDLNDPPAALVSVQADASGAFLSANFHLDGPTDVVANFFLEGEPITNAYAKGCGSPEGNLVIRVLGAQAAQQALALTGSNNTGTFVMIGVAAIVVGIVLTVGARRRSQISA
jgi:LPXTG-motif cell wall-anchored protein